MSDTSTDHTNPNAPIFDPDGDGKPGISWPAAAILIVVIIAVAVLAGLGVLDLNGLISAVAGAVGGGALARVRAR